MSRNSLGDPSKVHGRTTGADESRVKGTSPVRDPSTGVRSTKNTPPGIPAGCRSMGLGGVEAQRRSRTDDLTPPKDSSPQLMAVG